MPAFPFLLLLAATGLHTLYSSPLLGRSAKPWRALLALGASSVLAANGVLYSWPRPMERAGIAETMMSWEELGRWVGANTPPEWTLATGGAGIVPFYSKRRTIDMYGLTDSHIGRGKPLPFGFKAIAHEKYDPRYVLEQRPELLITGIDATGIPRTAGLARLQQWVNACYVPLLLVRSDLGSSGPRLLRSRVMTPALNEAGYRTVLLERRRSGLGERECWRRERIDGFRPIRR